MVTKQFERRVRRLQAQVQKRDREWREWRRDHSEPAFAEADAIIERAQQRLNVRMARLMRLIES